MYILEWGMQECRKVALHGSRTNGEAGFLKKSWRKAAPGRRALHIYIEYNIYMNIYIYFNILILYYVYNYVIYYKYTYIHTYTYIFMYRHHLIIFYIYVDIFTHTCMHIFIYVLSNYKTSCIDELYIYILYIIFFYLEREREAIHSVTHRHFATQQTFRVDI